MKKRNNHKIKSKRRTVAFAGLFAILAPLAVNFGLLGQTVLAQATEFVSDQTLVIKNTNKQKEQATTWTFDLTRPTASSQWASVEFDLTKAGLTDSKVTLDGDELAIDNGLVVFEATKAEQKLVLTAQHTGTAATKLELPIKLGLFADSKLQNNLLAENNQSVTATLDFKAVEASEATAIAPLVGPMPGDGKGYVTTDPRTTYNNLPNIKAETVEAVLIDRSTSTTPINKTSGATDPDNFQFWSQGNDVAQVESPNSIDGYNNQAYQQNNVMVTKKFNATVGKIDGGDAGLTYGQWLLNGRQGGQNYDSDQTQYNGTNRGPVSFYREVKTKYHSQYENNSTDGYNRSSYFVSFKNDAAMNGFQFSVTYDNVGSYVDPDGNLHAIGAVMNVSNILPASGVTNVSDVSKFKFIDVPNNLYSGLIYQGIASLDVEIHFYRMQVIDGKSTFTDKIDVDNRIENEQEVSKAQLTFASLNNFGSSGGAFSWGTSDYGIVNGNRTLWAESVSQLNNGSTTVNETATSNALTSASAGNGAKTAMQYDAGLKKWYSTTHGYYFPTGTLPNWMSDPYNRWIDELGSNTFERGSLSYKIYGTEYKFRLFSGTGNTWQSISSAANHALNLPDPKKSVTRPVKTNPDSSDYNTAVSGKNTANETAAENGDTSVEKSTPYTPVSDGNGLDAGDNAYDINLKDQLVPDANGMLNFNYWIFQPTYRIGVDSIAKPDMIKMVDLLPAQIEFVSAKVFNTNGQLLTQGTDFTVTTRVVGGRTEVTINLSQEPNRGIYNVDFNGNDIAFLLYVKTDADPDHAYAFVNSADMVTNISNKKTNDVKNSITPIESALQVEKTDANGQTITSPEGLEFTLNKTHDWDYVNDTVEQPALTTPELATPNAHPGALWTWENLSPGQYELEETGVPIGYDKDGDGKYTIVVNELGVMSDPNGELDFESRGTATENIYYTKVQNAKKSTHILISKLDAEGNPLVGSEFGYRVATTNTDYIALNDATGAPIQSGDLEFNVTYEIKETKAPDGHILESESVYFQVMTYADWLLLAETSGLDHQTTLTREAPDDVVFVKYQKYDTNLYNPVGLFTTSELRVTQGAEGEFLGTLAIKNYEKSIFPKTGAIGLVAFLVIGAGLVAFAIVKRGRR